MPIVTVDPEEFTRVPLKTAPPDGFVMLRPLPYGMKLNRRSKATKMMMRSKPVANRQEALKQDQIFELESHDEWAMAHDFAYCIGEHNLQNPDGTLIDFTKPMSLKMLDPRVGSEIEILIDRINNTEDEESFADFLQRQSMLPSEETSLSDGDGKDVVTPIPEPI